MNISNYISNSYESCINLDGIVSVYNLVASAYM